MPKKKSSTTKPSTKQPSPKKPDRIAVMATLKPQPQTGRRPKRPETVDARLEQLVKESDRWLRLFREIWFDRGDPLIEDAVGASEHEDLPKKYDEAIYTIQWVAESAAVAEELLRKGKRAARDKLRGQPKKSPKKSPRKGG